MHCLFFGFCNSKGKGVNEIFRAPEIQSVVIVIIARFVCYNRDHEINNKYIKAVELKNVANNVLVILNHWRGLQASSAPVILMALKVRFLCLLIVYLSKSESERNLSYRCLLTLFRRRRGQQLVFECVA